jgi:predicted dehydrogenase
MKALIIGYGSIGKRHEEVLSSIGFFREIDIVSKQKINNRNVFSSLSNVIDIASYDYFLIASETKKHFSQLRYIDNKVSDRKIFCEKPLFHETKNYLPKNDVFVGYVMRYHPIFNVLSELLENEVPIYVNVQVGSYLPSWRTNIDYRESYSADKERGGGVLLDLSHEIDYVNWLFAKIEEIKSIQAKISDLEITSDDITTFIGRTESDIIVNISMDYISKLVFREIKIHTNNSTITADFISGNIVKYNKNGIVFKDIISIGERNKLFEKMHTDILSNAKTACNYDEGSNVMEVIAKIQKENRL